jgi:hypothetical protein
MLVWFSLFVALAGLSIDTTRGFQSKTMLQATADAAVLAAVIDLPDEAAAVASAVKYAAKNLPPELYGDVVTAADVETGVWDAEAHIFTSGAQPADAVRVRARQTAATSNPVLANFLRIVGVTHWDLEVYAIAQKFVPRCFTDGLIARGFVDTSSNNQYFNKFCVHGQNGVKIQSGNYFELETNVSMPDLALLQLPTSGMAGNPGLEDALRQGQLDPRMVDHVPEIVAEFLNPQSYYIPDYIDSSQPVITVDTKFNLGDAVEGRIYNVTCSSPNKQISIPSSEVLRKVVIVSGCQIGVPAGASMEDVILATTAPTSNDGSNIHFSSGINLGKHDECADGGGVQIFTTESLFFSSSTNYNGVQIVSAKNVSLGSSDEGVKGLSVQARGNIYLSSNNKFGLCNGDDPLLFTHHFFRLVF